jgi:hypothetical protein
MATLDYTPKGRQDDSIINLDRCSEHANPIHSKGTKLQSNAMVRSHELALLVHDSHRKKIKLGTKDISRCQLRSCASQGCEEGVPRTKMLHLMAQALQLN